MPDQHDDGLRLGASTGCTYHFDVVTEESVDLLHAMGVRDVEIYLQCEAELDERFLQDLGARCAGLGLTVTSLHPYVFGFENLLFTPYLRQRRWATQQFERYLHAARLLGAPAYVSHGPPRHLVTEGSAFDSNYVRTTRQLIGLAETYGVRYCLENVSYGLVSTPDDVDHHLVEFGCALGLVVDVKSAWKAGFRPADFLQPRQLAAVSHLQLSFRSEGRYGLGVNGEIVDADVIDALRLCLRRRPALVPVLEIEARRAQELADTVQATRDLLSRLAAAPERTDQHLHR
ncbi:sugar phosphate isomerase/epimerase [Streptomyces sp. NPDC051219]|uniref:sugar phosphate isomerase/epimerase family protein n=1 Tax=Streptomyces sp. NPDC051219 TaxID=3155283 RepID=UPI0034389A85